MADVESAVSDVQTLANGETIEIKPDAAGQEWVIHNLHGTDDFTLTFTDDTNDSVHSFSGPRLLSYFAFHPTFTIWLVLTCTAVAGGVYGYDGVRTK